MESIKPTLQILTQEQKTDIHARALELLKSTGCKIECPEARALFTEKPGVTCDGEIVKLPSQLVEWAIDAAPRKVDIYDRLGNPAFSLGPDFNHETRFSIGSPHLNWQDPITWELETFKREHTGLMAGLTNTLDAYDALATPGTIQDYNANIADYYSTLEILAKSTKPLILLVSEDNQFEGVLSFADHLTGRLRETPHIIPYVNVISPLCLNKGTTDKIKITCEYGLPFILNNYAMSGASTPVTPAGTLVLLVAELLVGISFSQLVKEGTGIICGSLPNTFDMSSMTAHYAPKGMLVSHAMAEMMDHYQLPHSGTSGTNLGWGSDLIHAGILWMNHLPALMGKVGLCPFVGGVFQSTTLSACAVVLSSEIIKNARKYTEGFSWTEAEILMDEIKSVGPSGDFMGTPATFDRFRQYQPQSDVWPYLTPQKWEAGGKSNAEALLRQKTQELLDSPRVPHDADEMMKKGETYIEGIPNLKN